jgi:ceramide glucosyltransferase
MFSSILLALWTIAGLVWWALAWRLVTMENKWPGPVGEASDHRQLTVFKPLPPLGANGLDVLAKGLESFVAQLDAESELLLGIHEADRGVTDAFVARLQAHYPKARLKVIYRTEPDSVLNPKIAWQKILAPHAEGELWLWSDADIIAPPRALESMRREFARGGATMMTFSYVISSIPSPPAMLEALFVNVEFYPGVLLLQHGGLVDFAFGAAMLFQRDNFQRRVVWNELGAQLADDFFLGQKLGPVRIGHTRLETVAASKSWSKAMTHDLRWAKTIRWIRPGGSLSRIVILPIMGWLAYVATHPASVFAWLGLVAMVQADVFFAAAISRRVGCRVGAGILARMEIWSIWRIILWLAVCLPWPVVWSGRKWNKKSQNAR